MVRKKYSIPGIFISGIVSLALLSSCASIPEQTYLEKNRLSKFNKVAVNVSAAELEVKYSRETDMSIGTSASIAFFPLFGLAVMAAEGASKSAADRELAEDVKKNMEVAQFSNQLRGYFLENLKKANVFKTVGDAAADPKVHAKLLEEGYDSLIELDIKELALRKEYGDKLKVYANVWGKLTDLKSGEIVWNRQEVAMGNDEDTIEAFKADGGKILKEAAEQVFKKIASRLANDFIYLR